MATDSTSQPHTYRAFITLHLRIANKICYYLTLILISQVSKCLQATTPQSFAVLKI